MTIQVNFQDLLDAFDWVASGEAAGADCDAYVSRETGVVYWLGEDIPEDPPEDIGDESKYVSVPGKRDFNLGKSLALRFVEEHLSASYERVVQYFRSRGAYSRFKDELERHGQLNAWHEYEQKATEEALREWSEMHGFVLKPS